MTEQNAKQTATRIMLGEMEERFTAWLEKQNSFRLPMCAWGPDQTFIACIFAEHELKQQQEAFSLALQACEGDATAQRDELLEALAEMIDVAHEGLCANFDENRTRDALTDARAALASAAKGGAA